MSRKLSPQHINFRIIFCNIKNKSRTINFYSSTFINKFIIVLVYNLIFYLKFLQQYYALSFMFFLAPKYVAKKYPP